MRKRETSVFVAIGVAFLVACNAPTETAAELEPAAPPLPTRIIDLSSVIDENLPVRAWGPRVLRDFGFRETNEFEYVVTEEPLYVQNSYWLLSNHGGAHLDAPRHMDPNGRPVDEIRLDELVGRGHVVDYRSAARDAVIGLDAVQDSGIRRDEVFILLTGYSAPTGEDEPPAYPSLSREAAEYLATLPVKAFATDAFSVESMTALYEAMARGATGYEGTAPLHYEFLTRSIPVFEQLENLEALIGLDGFVFVGFPLRVAGSDGSLVRAAAFVY